MQTIVHIYPAAIRSPNIHIIQELHTNLSSIEKNALGLSVRSNRLIIRSSHDKTYTSHGRTVDTRTASHLPMRVQQYVQEHNLPSSQPLTRPGTSSHLLEGLASHPFKRTKLHIDLSALNFPFTDPPFMRSLPQNIKSNHGCPI